MNYVSGADVNLEYAITYCGTDRDVLRKEKELMRRVIRYMLLGLFVFLGAAFYMPDNVAEVYADDAEDKVVVEMIFAYYKGDSVLVGEEYNKEDVVVTAYYSDGNYQDVTDYITGSRVVRYQGTNSFVIVYGGKTSTIYVQGIRVVDMYALYSGPSLSVGNSVAENEVDVYVSYSDGTIDIVEEGFILGNHVIKTEGENKVTVVYGGRAASFTVIGTRAKPVSELMAVYTGEGQTVGMKIKTDNLSVVAIYTDGTTEVINNYTLTPDTISNLDANVVKVIYKNASTEVTITGIPKTPVELRAEYIGGSVEVGRYVRSKNIVVTVVYSDGAEEVLGPEDYFIKNSGRIAAEGGNTLDIRYMQLKTSIIVVGVLEQVTDFNTVPYYVVTDNKNSAVLKTALPVGYEEKDFAVKSLQKSLVKRCLSNDMRKWEYIPFAIRFEDEELELDAPMQMQIDLPGAYEMEGVKILYTPTRKTVVGEMDFEVIDDDTIEITLFNIGTYIILYDPDWKAKEELEKEEAEKYDPWW